MNNRDRFKFEIDKDNGMLIGPSGCHYNTEAEAMYFDQIKLCGCGQPAEIHKFLLECLSARKDNSDTILSHDKITEIVKNKPDIAAEFVLHFLDDRCLTEHGGSVYGSWLTERGKQVLEIGAMNER